MRYYYQRIGIAWVVLLCLTLTSISAEAQTTITNKGESISIIGVPVYVSGDLVNDTIDGRQGSVLNGGKIYLKGSLINNASNHLFVAPSGTVIFNGTQSQRVVGTSPTHFFGVQINKADSNLLLEQSVQVLDTLLLKQGNLFIGDHTVDFRPGEELDGTGGLVGENNLRRVFTGETGKGKIITQAEIDNEEIINPGQLGLTIFPTTGHTFGVTTIERGHGQQKGAGDGGILRYYDVTPEQAGESEAVAVQYLDDNELIGLNESTFSLWRSDDRGIVWRNQAGTVSHTTDQVRTEDIDIGTRSRITVSPGDCAENPVVNLGPTTTYLCEGDVLTLDAGNPGMFYQWSTGDSIQTIDINEAGTYQASVTNANGCVGSGTIEVIVTPYPTADFQANFTCLGGETVFTNSSGAAGGALTYRWDFGIAATDADTSNVAEPGYTYERPGNYQVKLVVTSETGCQDSVTQTVVVFPYPEANFSFDNACFDRSINFINRTTIASGGVTYYWDFGDGTTSSSYEPAKRYTQPGTYEVKLVATSNAGCQDSVIQTLSVYGRPSANFSFQSVCQGDDINLINTSSHSGSDLSFAWDFGDGTSTNERFPTKAYDASGFYKIILAVTSPYGCTDSLTQEITIHNCQEGPDAVDCSQINFTVDLGPDIELCAGERHLLNAETAGATYRWSDASTAATLSVDQPGEYWIEVTSKDGCLGKDYVTVRTLSQTLVNEAFLCQGGGITLDAGNPGSMYQWGSAQNSLGNERTIVVNEPGTYWATVRRGNCSRTDSVFVHPTSNTLTTNFLAASLVDVGDTIEFVQVSAPTPTSFYWDFGDGVTSDEEDPKHAYFRPGNYEVLLITGNDVCSDTLAKVITVRASRTEPADDEPVLFTELLDVSLFPNPTTSVSQLHVLLNQEAAVQVSVYTTNGIVLRNDQIRGEEITTDIDLSRYSPGLYLVKVTVGQQMKIKRIIKY